MMVQQQQAYKVAGVDEDAPALDARKRKAADDQVSDSSVPTILTHSSDYSQTTGNGNMKKQKAEAPKPEKKNNAIYVSSIPADADEEEIHQVFSKFGVIAESPENNRPRIKMYLDDQGSFKGDALIGKSEFLILT